MSLFWTIECATDVHAHLAKKKPCNCRALYKFWYSQGVSNINKNYPSDSTILAMIYNTYRVFSFDYFCLFLFMFVI